MDKQQSHWAKTGGKDPLDNKRNVDRGSRALWSYNLQPIKFDRHNYQPLININITGCSKVWLSLLCGDVDHELPCNHGGWHTHLHGRGRGAKRVIRGNHSTVTLIKIWLKSWLYESRWPQKTRPYQSMIFYFNLRNATALCSSLEMYSLFDILLLL